MKDGKTAEAKKYCDKAAENPSTMEWYKTWWFSGDVYYAIGVSKEESVKNLDPEPLSKAFDYYLKAMVLNFKDEQYHNLDIFNKPEDMIRFGQLMGDKNTSYIDNRVLTDLLLSKFPNLSVAFVNKGRDEYNEKQEYKNAFESFGRSLFLSQLSGKIDTVLIYYSAMAAHKAELFDEAVMSYEALIRMKYGDDDNKRAGLYLNLANVYMASEDTAKAIEAVKKGVEAYPNNNDELMVFLINYYLKAGKEQVAFDYLNKAIESTPDNASFHFALGTLWDKKIEIYQNEKQPDKVREARIGASGAYEKAVALKSDHTDAWYNLGAIYYNWGKDLFDMGDAEKDDAKRKALKDQSNEKYKESMNCFEKAHELDPADKSTIKLLKSLYYRFMADDESYKAKYDEMKKKLEE